MDGLIKILIEFTNRNLYHVTTTMTSKTVYYNKMSCKFISFWNILIMCINHRSNSVTIGVICEGYHVDNMRLRKFLAVINGKTVAFVHVIK